jgi:GNAT superfamily N-acetyltransferase
VTQEAIRIRPACSDDAGVIRRIAFDTGFFGDPMSALVDDPRRFQHALGCYLRQGASTGFIAEQAGKPLGYALASLRDVTLCTALVTAAGTMGDLLRLPAASAATRRYVSARITAALQAPFGDARRFRTPAGPRLHVNLLPQARGRGSGAQLMRALLDDLRVRGASQVHANSYQTARNNTEGFWLRHGFEEYSRVRTSAWSAFIADDVWLVCYRRKLLPGIGRGGAS